MGYSDLSKSIGDLANQEQLGSGVANLFEVEPALPYAKAQIRAGRRDAIPYALKDVDVERLGYAVAGQVLQAGINA